MKITEPLREEHKAFLPKIVAIENLADSVYSLSQPELEKRLLPITVFLQKHLIPHAIAEDIVLYPLIDKLSNCKEFTKTMSYDHNEITRLIRSLITSDHNNKHNLQKLLYQLHTVILLHFKKEEEIYVPFLDKKLQQKSAEELFGHMEKVAANAKEIQN